MQLLFSHPLCLTLCDPMDRVTKARPFCPSPSPGVCPSSCPLHWWCYPAISSSEALFFCPQSFLASRDVSSESAVCQITKVLEFQLQHQSFQWDFRVDFPWDWLIWAPCCPRHSQESSPAPQFKSPYKSTHTKEWIGFCKLLLCYNFKLRKVARIVLEITLCLSKSTNVYILPQVLWFSLSLSLGWRFTLNSVLVSMLFSQNIRPLPSPTESKSLFCTSVSLFLFCI